MSLVVFSGFAGLYAAPGELHPFLAAVAVLCIAVNAGAAGAINMWYERDIDAIMERTRGRPLPRGKMAPQDALTFGVVRSEEHTSELQSLMRISYAVFCLKKKK